ncbi:4Fe-4S dicluster domain-containing protein [Labilibacter marinus]|uniref:4Fe-4S dicluster domain-containing protein n=1 Tax=Labilibacter marinus TaxID=1477105 RepID=UPI0018E96D26
MKKNKVIISTPVHVNFNACDGCGVCVDVCSMNVFEIKEISKEAMNDLSFMGKIR